MSDIRDYISTDVLDEIIRMDDVDLAIDAFKEALYKGKEEAEAKEDGEELLEEQREAVATAIVDYIDTLSIVRGGEEDGIPFEEYNRLIDVVEDYLIELEELYLRVEPIFDILSEIITGEDNEAENAKSEENCSAKNENEKEEISLDSFAEWLEKIMG